MYDACVWYFVLLTMLICWWVSSRRLLPYYRSMLRSCWLRCREQKPSLPNCCTSQISGLWTDPFLFFPVCSVNVCVWIWVHKWMRVCGFVFNKCDGATGWHTFPGGASSWWPRQRQAAQKTRCIWGFSSNRCIRKVHSLLIFLIFFFCTPFRKFFVTLFWSKGRIYPRSRHSLYKNVDSLHPPGGFKGGWVGWGLYSMVNSQNFFVSGVFVSFCFTFVP